MSALATLAEYATDSHLAGAAAQVLERLHKDHVIVYEATVGKWTVRLEAEAAA